MSILKSILYVLPATLIASSFLNSASALMFDLQKFETPDPIQVPQNVSKSFSKVDLLWKFWENNDALLTLFKLKELKIFMKSHPEFLAPPSKEYISRIKYDARLVGNFSFLIKKRPENVNCENSPHPGKMLEMKIGEDSGDTVKEVANAFILKICPKEVPAKGLTVSADLYLDSNKTEKPNLDSWFSLEVKAINGIASEIKDSIEKKLPENLPLFLTGSLMGVNNQPILSVNVNDVMKTQCVTCESNRASNDSLKNVPRTSTSTNSKGTEFATSGK